VYHLLLFFLVGTAATVKSVALCSTKFGLACLRS